MTRYRVGRSSGGSSGGCAVVAPVVFGAIFAGAGLLFFAFLGPRLVGRWWAARSFVETPCTVLSSSVKTVPGSEGDMYAVDVRYAYTFQGRRYVSDRYDFSAFSSNDRAGEQKAADRYPAGSEAVCYVNPNDPSEALLKRGLGIWVLAAGFPLVFVAVGVGIAVGAIFVRRRRLRAGDRAVVVPAGGAVVSRGPTRLQPVTSRATRIAMAGCVALFWNGITWLFVAITIGLWVKGTDSLGLRIFMSLFMTPFVIVGVVLLGAFVKEIRKTTAAKPELTLDAAAAALGRPARLDWIFSGRVQRLRQLDVTLEGREEAQYRQGTTTATDKSTFARIEVFSTGDPASIARGTAIVTVPGDLVPSFAAEHNKVVWVVRVVASGSGPAVDEEFELPVVGASGGR